VLSEELICAAMVVNRSIPESTIHPLPGEIWAVEGDADCETLRYLLIIREPQDVNPKLVSVMVFSSDVAYQSHLNILIPPAISGLRMAVLAQTGQIVEMSIEYLHTKVGKRLSRQLYDLLLSIGDFGRGLVTTLPSDELIRSLGLSMTTAVDRVDAELLEWFDRHERAWAMSFQPTKLDRITNLVAAAIEIEREFIDLARERIDLAQWLQHIFPPDWQPANTFDLQRQIWARSALGDRERIAEILFALQSSDDGILHRQSIEYLSRSLQTFDRLAGLAPAIVSTLVATIERTLAAETRWQAISCLHQFDASHPVGGIRCVKSIDLGEIIHLGIHIVARPDRQMGIWLQVYPVAGKKYLPIDLKLVLQDETGQVVREIVARSHDYCLQLKFSGEVGETFAIGLELDGTDSIERFAI
jgi:hypothetical protein